MRRRSYRQTIQPTQNLDSFLDILTNTVGVLMFISLFVTLVTVEAETIIRTPLVTDSRKNPHFFEVRNNQLYYLDSEEVDRQLAAWLQALPQCQEPQIPEEADWYLYETYLAQIEEYEICKRQQWERLGEFQAQTTYYNVRLVNLNSRLYELKEGIEGESPEQLSQEESQFLTILQKLAPETEYLAFIVRPDSFAAFRAARKEAWDAGFDVGWEPQPSYNPIIFGSKGRAIGVQ
jgi:hypothetical protein